jgi:uncharacterized membrane protein
LLIAGSFTDFVLGVHILAVVVAFGATFAYPLIFAAARRADPSVMPWLFGVLQRIDRYIVNPGLTLVVIAGIVLATSEHRWGDFFVAWGVGAAIVIGAIVGSFMIPREGKLARIAARDLEAAVASGGPGAAAGGPGAAAGGSGAAAGGSGAAAGAASPWTPEYDKLLSQVSIGGAVLDLIVVVTIFMMATHA